MWPFRSKKGKERSSRPDGPSLATNPDQHIETLQNASPAATATSAVLQRPAQIIPFSSGTLNRTDKYGLLLLNPQTSHSDGAEAEETFLLDIVALHGITGDAYDTWTHENGKFWLRDFIPKQLPGARIFSFGYPAKVFCSLGTGHLDSFARSLLEGLKRERRRKEVRV
ncbi:MAG: hypothetical protein M1813_001607 [Trichoglossum hirsutum]|nr:MAG: hypothetical protein M1813_001607 [Trichoglossum hirsutum]